MDINEVNRSLQKRYRTKLYKPFIKAIEEYELLKDGDKVAVCISGGKDSFVLAKLFGELVKYSDYKIEVKYLVMNPGYNEENLIALKENAKKLDIPIIIKNSDVFQVAYNHGGEHPCYLCARMRRGFLYRFAHDEGCNKIALGHHFNDVIETTMLNVLYAGCFKTMLPKVKSASFAGMELIRPLFHVREKDIINFINYAEIKAMACGCKVAEGQFSSKRKEIKTLIQSMKLTHKDVDQSIFMSAVNVNIDLTLGYKKKGKKYSFLDFYEDNLDLEE